MSQPEFTAIRLQFHSGMHLARRSDDLGKSRPLPSSDSLKAALTACHAQILGPRKTEALLLAFMHSFALSSAFPSGPYGALYLPKPIGLDPFATETPAPGDAAEAKARRKLQYLPLAAFRQHYLQGQALTGKSARALSSPQSEAQAVQRVRVAQPWHGRIDAEPYLVERLTWEECAGPWFLLQCADAAAQAAVMSALHLLGDSGLGQGKTYGGGTFTFTTEPIDLSCDLRADDHLPQSAQPRICYLALGRYLPQLLPDRPIQWPHTWSLAHVGGFLAGASDPTQRRHLRRTAYMFGEGSLFAHDPRGGGDYIDLAPASSPHPAYRDGRCICLPILIAPTTPLPSHESHD
jgi:CRISPR type III-A-associated RAMP protein Csm4